MNNILGQEKRSVVSRQRSVVSGQWSAVSGQPSVVSGQWSVVSRQWSAYLIQKHLKQCGTGFDAVTDKLITDN
ncbi:MAG: hypothetical protein F6K56_24210 [Moorea sp. SIO3G5]|nr:hypothetical protein [Moorena sp. SIO3G5]